VQQQGTQNHQSHNPALLLSVEPLLFSAMSDHQIAEAINNAGDELKTPDFQIDDTTGLEWQDWFSFDYLA
jgi:hypothetical protein